MITARDGFILGVRLLGAWLLTRAMSYLGSFIDTRFGFTPTRSDYSPHGNLIYFALDVALAVYFLLGTRHLAELCYGPGDGKPRTLPPDDAQ